MNNSKLFPMAVVAFFMFTFLSSTFAQIEVNADGRVAVGSSQVSSAQLNVNQSNFSSSLYLQNSFNTNGTKYGVRNYVFSAGTGTKYGIYNYVQQNSNATSATNGIYNRTFAKGTHVGYGIYNKSSHTGSGTHKGIYNESTAGGSNSFYGLDNQATYTGTGTAYGINNYVTSTGKGKALYTFYYGGSGNENYGMYNLMITAGNGTGKGIYSYTQASVGEAGYFDGDIFVAGTVNYPSDLATKKNVTNISNALALIGQLVPKSYEYKTTMKMNLPEGEQYGFIAQELEKVLPTLVKDINVVNPKEIEKEGEVLEEIKSVNYTGLTPILVKAVQEQQDLIQQQQKLIEQLNQRLERLEQK